MVLGVSEGLMAELGLNSFVEKIRHTGETLLVSYLFQIAVRTIAWAAILTGPRPPWRTLAKGLVDIQL